MTLPLPDDPHQPPIDPLYAMQPDAATVAVTGAVNIATAHLFERHISHALKNKPSCLVIDLNSVTFLAAAGLGVLTRARVAASQQGTVLVLRGVNRRCVAQPLKISGMWSLFLID